MGKDYHERICVICQEDLNRITRVKPCNHAYHTSCIQKWAETSERCPTCSRKFGTSEGVEQNLELNNRHERTWQEENSLQQLNNYLERLWEQNYWIQLNAYIHNQMRQEQYYRQWNAHLERGGQEGYNAGFWLIFMIVCFILFCLPLLITFIMG
ncbi:unnamed protein product [Ambrosiozyma monospora]|uniref:Unnamed protein product n=1 Tax=Ambrosiozyma monospora TaxID=43982 RepID=A0ACB5T668_AMBMO|nr:unnamed protein product [Ambrosiozyma monospora]